MISIVLSGVCGIQCLILAVNSEGFSCGNTCCFEIPIILKNKSLKNMKPGKLGLKGHLQENAVKSLSKLCIRAGNSAPRHAVMDTMDL